MSSLVDGGLADGRLGAVGYKELMIFISPLKTSIAYNSAKNVWGLKNTKHPLGYCYLTGSTTPLRMNSLID